MINSTEQEEREYLEVIKEKLLLTVKRVDDSVKQYSTELREKKQYIHEHQSGMDEADMVAAGQSIDRMAFTGESAVARKRKLIKLFDSPYFGRIDFSVRGSDEQIPYYIGIHSFSDESMRQNLIYDWRAPVSSMFYDFELGDADYMTPAGTVSGTIKLKRQYRIRDAKMEFMIENELNIQDEVLQEELSKSSDQRMKTIVATIQRDQNAVIRNESSRIMIIQGVAGSGKTSIALHRIAFLLYRFRDSISAKDILIISPNKVFASYISNVLPELCEEHIPEMGIEELAAVLMRRAARNTCCPSTRVSPFAAKAVTIGISTTSTPMASPVRPCSASTSWTLAATAPARSAAGGIAPRSVEMPAREPTYGCSLPSGITWVPDSHGL